MRRSSRKATIDSNPDPLDRLLAHNTAANSAPSTSADLADYSTADSTASASKGKRKRAQQDEQDLTAAPGLDDLSASTATDPARRKRKSVTFEDLEPAPVASSSRATR